MVTRLRPRGGGGARPDQDQVPPSPSRSTSRVPRRTTTRALAWSAWTTGVLLLTCSVDGFLLPSATSPLSSRSSIARVERPARASGSPFCFPLSSSPARRPSVAMARTAVASSSNGNDNENASTNNQSPTRLDASVTMDPPTTTALGRRRSARALAQLPAPHANDKPDVKLGVLLLQLGGPERTEDVEGFLYNLFADPDIIRLPGIVSGLQKPLAYVISKRRAPKSKAAYASIGGGSPIVRYTAAQAEGVERVLRQDMGLDAKCYVAMRYWHPFTHEALEQMQKDGVNSLVVVPLYPQFSISTSGSSLRVLQDLFFKDSPQWGKVSHTVVPAWYDRPGYVQAMGRLISRELAQFTPEQRAQGPLHVLFSAHGVPQRYIEMGDPYQQQIRKCVELIAQEYSAEVTTHLSYQSRVGPIEWLRPYTDDMLEELGASGVKNLVVVPISFVSEHIETLEEIDIEYRELAEENGIANWRRVPALNTEEGFIEDLAHMVVEALQEPAISVTEACALNNLDIMPIGGAGSSGDGPPVDGKLALLGIAGSVVLDLLTGKGLPHVLGMH